MTNTTTPSPATPSRARRRLVRLGGGGLLLVAMLIGVGLWMFFRGDEPAEVDLEAALAANADSIAEAADASGPIPEPADTERSVDAEVPGEPVPADAPEEEAAAEPSVDGSWVVDTSLGSFDFESATGSFAGFRVDEELQGIGSTTAVGRTGEVVGGLTIVDDTATDVVIEVDVSTLTTNDSRRDGAVAEILNTDEHPVATFALTEPIDLGPDGAAGEPVATTAAGTLTIAGVTNPVVIDLDAQLEGDVIVVVGSTDIVFGDYGIEVPSNAVVQVDDVGIVEFQLLFTHDG